MSLFLAKPFVLTELVWYSAYTSLSPFIRAEHRTLATSDREAVQTLDFVLYWCASYSSLHWTHLKKKIISLPWVASCSLKQSETSALSSKSLTHSVANGTWQGREREHKGRTWKPRASCASCAGCASCANNSQKARWTSQETENSHKNASVGKAQKFIGHQWPLTSFPPEAAAQWAA